MLLSKDEVLQFLLLTWQLIASLVNKMMDDIVKETIVLYPWMLLETGT